MKKDDKEAQGGEILPHESSSGRGWIPPVGTPPEHGLQWTAWGYRGFSGKEKLAGGRKSAFPKKGDSPK